MNDHLTFNYERTKVNEERVMHFIICKKNNNMVGYIDFCEYKNVKRNFFILDDDDGYIIPHILYFQKIYVEVSYRKQGIAKRLYEYFNAIYNSDFKDIPIYRRFENPIAEYTVLKCIKNGSINPNSYNPEFIEREYDEEDMKLMIKLTSFLNNSECLV